MHYYPPKGHTFPIDVVPQLPKQYTRDFTLVRRCLRIYLSAGAGVGMCSILLREFCAYVVGEA